MHLKFYKDRPIPFKHRIIYIYSCCMNTIGDIYNDNEFEVRNKMFSVKSFR